VQFEQSEPQPVITQAGAKGHTLETGNFRGEGYWLAGFGWVWAATPGAYHPPRQDHALHQAPL